MPCHFRPTEACRPFTIKGRVTAPNDPGPHGSIRLISPDYFSTLRIPLLRGRFFTAEDRAKTEQVAMIDTTLAHQYWPNEDPSRATHRFWGRLSLDDDCRNCGSRQELVARG